MTLPAVAAAGPAGPVPPWWPRAASRRHRRLSPRLPVSTEAAMPGSNSLSSIQHVVVLMLENRSFDHMLGFLYTGSGNVSPAGQPFDGLTGTESNPDVTGPPVTVFKIEPDHPERLLHAGRRPRRGLHGHQRPVVRAATPPRRARRAVPSNAWLRQGLHLHARLAVAGGRLVHRARHDRPATSWAASPRRRCPCCPRWPGATPSATSGSPRCRPRRCPTARSPARAPARGTWTTRRRRSPRPSIFGLLDSHGQSLGDLRLRRRSR